MALTKVATQSIGPDGLPIYDVFSGTEHIQNPSDPRLAGVNIAQLPTGMAPTGFQSQFIPTEIPKLTAPKLETALGSTPSDTQALYQTKLDELNKKNADFMTQALAKIQLSPEEKASQSRLLGLQQLQNTAVEQAQERPLDGTVLRSGLASEIQNITSGNTRESLVNLRMQTQEASRLNLLTNQRTQELDALKLQLDQGNIDTQNLFKAQTLSEDIKNSYFDKVMQLNQRAQSTLSTILDRFQGLTVDQLSPESAAQLGSLAQQAGIPMEMITEGMKVAKNQIDIQNAQEAYKNQTSRINAGGGVTSTGTDITGVSPITGKPLTAAQLTSKGFYDRTVEADKIISEVGGQFTGGLSYITQYAPNVFKSEDRQRYEQAQRDFINAVLRPESGAAISPSEFDSAAKQYFPQPGDSTVVVAQKAANRQTKINSLALQAGQYPTSTTSSTDLRTKYDY